MESIMGLLSRFQDFKIDSQGDCIRPCVMEDPAAEDEIGGAGPCLSHVGMAKSHL